MTLRETQDALDAAGVTLSLSGSGGLQAGPRERLTDELRQAIRDNKAELIEEEEQRVVIGYRTDWSVIEPLYANWLAARDQWTEIEGKK